MCLHRGRCQNGHCLDFCAILGQQQGKIMSPCLCVQNGRLVVLTGSLAVKLALQGLPSQFI